MSTDPLILFQFPCSAQHAQTYQHVRKSHVNVRQGHVAQVQLMLALRPCRRSCLACCRPPLDLGECTMSDADGGSSLERLGSLASTGTADPTSPTAGPGSGRTSTADADGLPPPPSTGFRGLLRRLSSFRATSGPPTQQQGAEGLQRAVSGAVATPTAASGAAGSGSGFGGGGGTGSGSGKSTLRRSMSLQPPLSPMAASAVQQQAAPKGKAAGPAHLNSLRQTCRCKKRLVVS